MQKTYFREKHSRHLWSLECDEKGEWKTEYIQIGACLETEKALDLMLSFVAYNAETDKIQIPPPEFYEIKSHIGYSGCRDFYAQTGGHIRYDIIPGTDIIQEYKTPVKRIPLVYSSMNDKVNSGLTITWDTFWSVLQVYLEYFEKSVSEKDEGLITEQVERWWGHYRECYETRDFEEVQEKGIELPVDTSYVKIKVAPDNSFFILSNNNSEYLKINTNIPHEWNHCSLLRDDFFYNQSDIINALKERDIISYIIEDGEREKPHRWIFLNMLNNDWFFIDKEGRVCERHNNPDVPCFFIPNKFEKPEHFQVYFCTKDNVICLENQGFWTRFDRYFFNGFGEEELEKMIATLNEKIMCEVIHLYKTEHGAMPLVDIADNYIKICIRDKNCRNTKKFK